MYNVQGNFLSLEEMMEQLEIGRNTAYRLLKEKKVKAFRIGSRWKIPATAVNDYIFHEQHST